MTNQPDVLDPLFSDSGAFDEEKAVKALQPHLTIQRSTNSIFFKDTKLSATKKILAYALAKKLLSLRKLVDSDKITAAEFYEATKINKGTIDPSFKSLKDKGYLIGKQQSELSVNKISEIISMLNNKNAE